MTGATPSLPKLAGIETEFGILIRGAEESDPFLASRLLLQQCEEAGALLQPPRTTPPAGRSNPVPIRGGRAVVAAAAADSLAEADEDEFEPPGSRRTHAGAFLGEGYERGRRSPDSLMLPNGARFYIDHAHPEYSTAEAVSPRDVVAADKAGEVLVERCRQRANRSPFLRAGESIAIYKNNSDQKGNSYGCHENYLVNPPTYEDLICRRIHRTLAVLVPFLVTRPLLCGAGKVGAENGCEPAGYQLVQRADFFETLIGLQTTFHRPLINTRDEPHGDPARFRRLHVIVGDANLAEVSTFLKIGTTQLVLKMLEDDFCDFDLTLDDPIDAVRAVSRDLSFQRPLRLRSQESRTALQIQRHFLEAAGRYLQAKSAQELSPPESPASYAEVLQMWGDTLDKLERDWRQLDTRLDWAIKRKLLERYLTGRSACWDSVRAWTPVIEATLGLARPVQAEAATETGALVKGAFPGRFPEWDADLRRQGLEWDDYWRQREIYFDLRRLDLQYHDLCRGPEPRDVGLFYRLQQTGNVDRLLKDADIERFVGQPPGDTRARKRGHFLARMAPVVDRADWSSVQFWDAKTRQPRLLELPDPLDPGDAQFDRWLADEPAVTPAATAPQMR